MIVGCDVGFGHVKTVTEYGADEFPAVVTPWDGEHFRIETASGRREPTGLRYRGRSYLAGIAALRQGHRRLVSLDREWIASDVHRTLLLFALQRARLGSGREVRLVTGLPVGDLDRHAVTARVELLGHQKIERLPWGDPWEVTITDVEIMPQPFGTLLALVLDDAGGLRDRALAEARVGIIDIGFLTTDYLRVDGLAMVPARSLTRNTGMADCLLDVGRAIQSTHGLELDPHDVDEAVLRGRLRLSGTEVELRSLVDPLFTEHAQAIAAHATMLWGHGQALDAVLVTGGGAELLGRHLTTLAPHVRVVPNARLANATGYYRYGRRQSSQRQGTR